MSSAPEKHDYVYEPPEGFIFDEYMTEYSAPDCFPVASGIRIAECHGHSNQFPHKFVASAGVECGECGVLCCPCWCIYQFTECRYFSTGKNAVASWTCLKCNASPEIPDFESLEEMKLAIESKGGRVPEGMSFAKIQELHDSLVENGQFEIDCNAVYPLLPSSSLDDGTFQSLCRFSFSDGARFIHDDSFSTELLVALIHLVATSVVYSDAFAYKHKCIRFVSIL